MKCPSCRHPIPDLKATVCGHCNLDLSKSPAWQHAVRRTKLAGNVGIIATLAILIGIAFYLGVPQMVIRLLEQVR